MSRAKATEVIKSSNARVTLLSILLLAMEFNNISVGYSPEQLIDMFSNPKGIALPVYLQLFQIGQKLLNKFTSKEWDWGFLKSQNFRVMVSSILAILVGAILGYTEVGVFAALIGNIWNFVDHTFFKKAKFIQPIGGKISSNPEIEIKSTLADNLLAELVIDINKDKNFERVCENYSESNFDLILSEGLIFLPSSTSKIQKLYLIYNKIINK